jgi:hypothetical protein
MSANQLSLFGAPGETVGGFPPSEEQRAIFDWFRQGAGHLVVRARAGCGKTSSICIGSP